MTDTPSTSTTGQPTPTAPTTPAPAAGAPSPAELADKLTGPPTDPAPAEGDDRATEVKTLRRENAAWRTKLREAETRLAELEAAQQTEAEKERNAAVAEAVRETTTKFHKKLLTAEVGRLAAELRFRDPADAARLVDLDQIEPGPDGEIDAKALRGALQSVAEAKPYLAESEPTIPTARDVGLGAAGGDPAGGYDRYSVADFDKEFFGEK